MSFIYHIFGIIFYIIWSIIGALILAALIMVFVFKPWNMMSGGAGLGLLTNMMGSLGGVGDILKTVQNQGGIKESFNNLPKQAQDCIKKQMGEKNFNDLMSGKTQLTSAIILQATACWR